MSNKTAMMKLYDMLDEGQISEIAEIKEYFLMLEERQMEEAVSHGISNADMTNNRGYFDFQKYYNETYKGGEQ